MIEIHSHVLPGVDDGANNMDESVAIVEDMIANGVTAAIATPHHRNGYDINPYGKVVELTDRLNGELKSRNIDFQIYPGQEVRISDEIPDLISSGDIKGIAGTKYLLLEPPSRSLPMYVKELLYRLTVQGYKPVIAHPERNSRFTEDFDLLHELVNMGCLVQITSESLIASNKKLKSTSEKMIEEGLVSLISSDTHGVNKRKCRIMEALKRVEALYGKELADYFSNNTYKLVNGETINGYGGEIRKKSFLKRFFK